MRPVSGLVVDPDVERRAPEALARERPVDVVAQEVAEAAVADVLGQPLDPGVVLEALVHVGGGAHVPGGPRVLDQRIVVRAHAERVLVPDLLRVPAQPALLELAGEVAVGLLHPAARVRRGRQLRVEAAVGPHGAEQGQVGPLPALGLQQLEVHLAKGGRSVHHAGARVEVDEVAGHHPPQVGALLATGVPVEGRHVATPHQLPAGQPALDRELATHLLGQALAQRLGEHQPLVAVPDQRVLDLRMHDGEAVRGQRPGRGGPDEQGGVGLVGERQARVDRGVVHAAIALSHLGGREHRAALGPPPDHLVTAIQQVALEELRERPPDALDVGLVVGDVGVAHVDPEAELLGEALPLLGVAEDALEAAADEGLDPVLHDRVLARDPQLLLDLDLDRQPVGVPAGAARNVEAPHRLVAGDDVLHHAGERVAVVRHAVRGRRSLVEDEAGPAPAPLQGAGEDPLLAPEIADPRLCGGEVGDRGDALEDRPAHRAHKLTCSFAPVPQPAGQSRRTRAELAAGRPSGTADWAPDRRAGLDAPDVTT
jgi:hypothetical protein